MIDEYTFSKRELLYQKLSKYLKFWVKQKMIVSFEGRFADFDSARKLCGGYEEQTIFEKVKNAAIAVKEGKACYERDGYLFYEKEYY